MAGLVAIDLGVPSVLHGINDWDPVNGGMLRVLVTALSTLLFLGYARVGLPAAPTSASALAPRIEISSVRQAVVVTDPVTEPRRMPLVRR